MVFNEDIKVTMYSLEIIDSIIKTPTFQVTSQETGLRIDWVPRFLKEGGFSQLLTQLKRALAMAKDALTSQDTSSESSNITKKFIDQMLKLMKTFIFAAIYADQEANKTDDILVLKRHASTASDKVEKEKVAQKKQRQQQDEA